MSFGIRSLAALTLLLAAPAFADPPHNLILFVPDGLRAAIVDATTAPTFARLRDEGVNFVNSHSLFPTFTTANASAFATGHTLGDTGDFSNAIYSRFPMASAGNTVTPFLESDPVLREMNADFSQNYLSEASIIALARAAGDSTALIGKLGPTAIFDVRSLDDPGDASRTLIIDDSTGKEGAALPSEPWRKAFETSGVPLVAPSRGENGYFGAFDKLGTLKANTVQQQYFLDVALKVALPAFKTAGQPFVLVYWSRDPDGTQHNQGDSFRSLTPGINGPTSLAAIKSADDALAALESKLKELDLYETTDIIVAADHGFSTISKVSKTSPAASKAYDDVNAGELPYGFLAIDLAIALKKSDPTVKLFDPDHGNAEVDWERRMHPSKGNGLIGADPKAPEVIVAANGGSDLVYLGDMLSPRKARQLARTLVRALLREDYASGLFVDEAGVGSIAGALSTRSIGLAGAALTPHPAIVVNFQSFTTGCDQPTLCTAMVADTILQQGQGMHGSFSRADTWNFMAARGPDFRADFVDHAPASNADIGMTIAKLLGVTPTRNGQFVGRVLSESLRGSEGTKTPAIRTATLVSGSGFDGLKTTLNTQSVGDAVYFDAAGFPGRTVGLESKK
jgi:hypothetical protein